VGTQISRSQPIPEFLQQIKAPISDIISLLPTPTDTSFSQPCSWEFHFQPILENEFVVVTSALRFNFASLFMIMKIIEYQIRLKL
jgi:hypothetical protein